MAMSYRLGHNATPTETPSGIQLRNLASAEQGCVFGFCDFLFACGAYGIPLLGGSARLVGPYLNPPLPRDIESQQGRQSPRWTIWAAGIEFKFFLAYLPTVHIFVSSGSYEASSYPCLGSLGHRCDSCRSPRPRASACTCTVGGTLCQSQCRVSGGKRCWPFVAWNRVVCRHPLCRSATG